MLDQVEIAEWERVYFREGMAVTQGAVSVRKVRAWARSMALIVEQHIDNDGDEPVEAEFVS